MGLEEAGSCQKGKSQTESGEVKLGVQSSDWFGEVLQLSGESWNLSAKETLLAGATRLLAFEQRCEEEPVGLGVLC